MTIFWDIVFTIISGVSLGLILLRVFNCNRVMIGSHIISLSLELPADVSSAGNAKEGAGKAPITKKELLNVILWAAFIRLFLYVFSAYTAPLFEVGDGSLSDLMTRWANWDGSHYLNLAELGYSDFIEDGEPIFLVFFPLYPWVIRALHVLIRNYQLCAYIVSCVSFIAGCCFLYALAAKEWNRTVAMRAVILISLFPFSFFFGAVRTESLFFLTSVASLYYIRRHRFLPAAIWGALASLTRMHGILLGVAAVAEVITYYKPFHMLMEKQWKQFRQLMLTKVIFIPFIAVGTILYLCLNAYVTGDCFAFLFYEEDHWSQSSQFFTKTLGTILTQAQGAETAKQFILWMPQFVLFVFALLVLIYGIRRVSATYSIYFFVYLFLNYSITWPLSCGRYMTCALPMFLILAKGSEKHPNLYRAMLVVFVMLLACYIPLFLDWQHLY